MKTNWTKATLRHYPYDAEGWNADLEKLRAKIIDENGPGEVRFRIEHDNSRVVLWSHRGERRRSVAGQARDAEIAAQGEAEQ